MRKAQGSLIWTCLSVPFGATLQQLIKGRELKIIQKAGIREASQICKFCGVRVPARTGEVCVHIYVCGVSHAQTITGQHCQASGLALMPQVIPWATSLEVQVFIKTPGKFLFATQQLAQGLQARISDRASHVENK
jgi:hypothetical protein